MKNFIKTRDHIRNMNVNIDPGEKDVNRDNYDNLVFNDLRKTCDKSKTSFNPLILVLNNVAEKKKTQ